MKILANIPGVMVRHCDGHGVVNVTVLGTTLHLEESAFVAFAGAVYEAATTLRHVGQARDCVDADEDDTTPTDVH